MFIPPNRTISLAPNSLHVAICLALASNAFPAAAADAPESIEIIGHNKRDLRDLPSLRGPLIDTSQLVSTISAETLQDRQVTSLEDALRNVAGITTQIGEGGVVNGDQFFIRGQAAKNDIFTDGLRDFGAFTRDSFNFENVAVLKGPSSTALGRGVSGGAINSGSKLATLEDLQSVSGAAGTASYQRGLYDGNVVLSDNSAVRVNLMAHENDAVSRDLINSKRWGAALAAGFGLGTNTNTHLLYLHQDEDRIPDYGVPIAVTTATTDIEQPVSEFGVPQTAFYGYARGDADNVQVDTLTLLFNHQFNESLTLSSASKVGRYERYFRQSVASCPAATCGNLLTDNNASTVPQATIGAPGPYDQTTQGIQNLTSLLLRAPLWNMRNELVVGWDLSRQTNERSQFNYIGTRAPKDLFAPIHSPVQALAPGYANVRDNTGTDYSLFIDERLWLTDTFSVNAGVRVQRFNNQQEQINYPAVGATTLTTCDGVTGTFATCVFTRKASNTLSNPKVAAMWEPADNLSLYLSYSASAVPPGNSVGNGDALSALGTGASISTANLDPEKSDTLDVGVKWALFEQKLLLQAGLYQTGRSNAQETDQATGVLVVSGEPSQQLRGFEFGASGVLGDSLSLNFNYSHIDAEIIEAFSNGVIDAASIGKQVRFVPEDSASAWLSWEPLRGGWLQNLKLGAGLSYQSKIFLNLQNTQVTPAYTSIDALVSYELSQFRFALNGYNLSDEKYYSQVNGGRVVPAAGRSFVASLQYNF